MNTFVNNTVIDPVKVNQNFTDLSTGDGDVTANSLSTYRQSLTNHVVSGCAWKADAAGSTRNASMTSGVVIINGEYLTVAAVTARSFTASKDTYVDFKDNGDGTASINYTEVSNNAASPALYGSGTSTDTLRNAIITTGASSIAASTNINQGQVTATSPTISSSVLMVSDYLGNLICNRSPNPTLIGYRQITSNVTTTSSTATQIPGLSAPVIVPTGRKVKVSFYCLELNNSTANKRSEIGLWDGTVGIGSGTKIQETQDWNGSTASVSSFVYCAAIASPTTSSKTYNAAFLTDAVSGGTVTLRAGSTAPAFIMVELI